MIAPIELGLAQRMRILEDFAHWHDARMEESDAAIKSDDHAAGLMDITNERADAFLYALFMVDRPTALDLTLRDLLIHVGRIREKGR